MTAERYVLEVTERALRELGPGPSLERIVEVIFNEGRRVEREMLRERLLPALVELALAEHASAASKLRGEHHAVETLRTAARAVLARIACPRCLAGDHHQCRGDGCACTHEEHRR